MMRAADWERLDADYPEWKWMEPAEVLRRFWMYDPQLVAQARLVAVARKLYGPLEKWQTRFLQRWLP